MVKILNTALIIEKMVVYGLLLLNISDDTSPIGVPDSIWEFR